MFGKNYDQEIKEIREILGIQIKNLNTVTAQQNKIMDMFNQIQDNMIELAKSQAAHKQSITFLLNHATVDEDAKEDFIKMLKNIKEVNDIAKENDNI